MNIKRLALGLSLVPLLAGCAINTPGGAPNAPAGGAAVSPPAPAAPAAPNASQTPGMSTPAVTPPPPSPTSTEPPEPPKPTLPPEAKKEFGKCWTQQVRIWTGGPCTKLVQKKLKAAKILSGPITHRADLRTVNAILNYQRSRGLPADGVVGQTTWLAMATKQKSVPEVLPEECQTKGVVLCVDQAHRKLKYVKNGKVKKTIAIRLGGYNSHPKTHKWRVFPTAKGTWKVYNKNVSPCSENYGCGAMPYSVMFHPDMYVHYSPDFARRGYATSSHGCVNVRSIKDAVWFFRNTPIGAKVHVF